MIIKEIEIKERLGGLLLPVRLDINGWLIPFNKIEAYEKDLMAFIMSEIKRASDDAYEEGLRDGKQFFFTDKYGSIRGSRLNYFLKVGLKVRLRLKSPPCFSNSVCGQSNPQEGILTING